MSRRPSKAFRLSLALVILSSCIGCDQATKKIATESLSNAPVQSYFGDTVRLEYALNPGGFLSLGSQLAPSVRFWLFVVLNAAFMLLVLAFLIARWDMRLAVFVPVVYLLSGGIGNLIDRTTQNGLVTDFINIGIGPIRSGIFNVADIAVLFGTIAAIYFSPRHDGTQHRLSP